MFEKQAKECKWPEKRWVCLMSYKLKGIELRSYNLMSEKDLEVVGVIQPETDKGMVSPLVDFRAEYFGEQRK